jgi:predicted TIM-barrel fold metal-dependent hydrolase
VSVPGAIDYWCNGLTPEFAQRWGAATQELELGRSSALQAALRELAEPGPQFERLARAGVRAVVIPAIQDGRPDERPRPAMSFEPVWSTVDEVRALAQRHPGRVFGMATVNPFTGMAGVRRFRQLVEQDGFVALHIHTHTWDKRLDDRDYYPFYAACADLGVPVVAQVGHSADLTPSECGRPMSLDRPALYFPDVTFVMSHTGWPWVDEAVAMATKHTNVFVGTATYPPRRWASDLVEFARRRGAAKTLFGTGFPVLQPGPAIAELMDLGLADEAVAQILEGNARHVFGIVDRLAAA